MSKLVIGKLNFSIYNLKFTDGKLMMYARCNRPKLKWIPQEGPNVPYALYGDDGSLVAVGRMSPDDFDEARRELRDGDIYLIVPLEFTTEFIPKCRLYPCALSAGTTIPAYSMNRS